MALRADERRDKLRKAMGRSTYPSIHGCLNGETRLSKPQSPYGKSIAIRREPPELKHLSRERKRKKESISLVAASERERAQTEGLVLRGNGLSSRKRNLAERFWESLPERVKAPYAKEEPTRQYPEYRETRGTLREIGGTTPQG